jgi:predicted anti-sigma-YlaC factor YlaD
VLDCNATLELIPAMLLDALDADETVAVQAHLRYCTNCRTEAESFRPVIGLMGLAAPEAAEPSPRVKQRLMAQISPRSRPVNQPRRWFFRPLAMFATAAAVLALAFGVWGYTQQAQMTQQQARLDRLTQQQVALRQVMLDGTLRPVPVHFEGQTSASAVMYAASDQVVMAVDGLPSLTGDEVYQCWWENTQDWSSVAGTTFKVDEMGAGVWAWDRPAAGDFDKMLVTREKRAGVDKHYGPLILTASLK